VIRLCVVRRFMVLYTVEFMDFAVPPQV
jgi:hypothetical protein